AVPALRLQGGEEHHREGRRAAFAPLLRVRQRPRGGGGLTVCLGPLLLTPQPVRRATALPADLAFVDELVALVGRLASDPTRGEVVMGEIRAELEALGERLFAAAEDGLGNAEARLRALWADWLAALEAFAAAPPSLETVDDVLAMVEGAV